jgi:hypothetical protein
VAQKLKPNADDIYILAVARAGQMEKRKIQVRDYVAACVARCRSAANDNFGMETSESILDNFRFDHRRACAIAMVVISSVV